MDQTNFAEEFGVLAQRPLAPAPQVEGRLCRSVGLTLQAEGLELPLGHGCQLQQDSGDWIPAEVVGFTAGLLHLMPVRHVHGVRPGTRVRPLSGGDRVPVGRQLLGRVIDGLGAPLDGAGSLEHLPRVSRQAEAINPLHRQPVRQPLDVGVRAINGLLTVGRGQRMGIFAGSGVGKSVLLGMMTRFTEAEVIVVGLVGERGREVREFIQEILGPEGMSRAVVVAAPADDPPLMRLRAAELATRIAEDFRDRGQQVLLLIDSLTRYAQAQREIALAVGEPPATRGYPPSVFARLPALVERAGNGAEGQGSLTAFYTVLMEGDDEQDPIADSARAILDGHIMLSRALAEQGQYPAIDPESSISRLLAQLREPGDVKAVHALKQCYAEYQRSRDLIQVGAYQPGSDPQLDQAIQMMPAIRAYLSQDMRQPVSLKEAHQALQSLINGDAGAAQ